MTKKESTKANVRINKVDENTDEVFITADEPYVNKVIYVKAGSFKEGEYSLETLEKKEEESRATDGSKLGQIEPAKG